jgi:hypothetical protein
MNRAEAELHDEAVARWENEGGTTLSPPEADGKAGIWLISSLFSSLVPSMSFEC